MAFLVVVKNREDGDYESLAAFSDEIEQSKMWATEVLEYFENEQQDEAFNILKLQNVDEIISQELIGLENTT